MVILEAIVAVTALASIASLLTSLFHAFRKITIEEVKLDLEPKLTPEVLEMLQGNIELHDFSELDDMKTITPEIAKTIKKLELIATLWNHDLVEKEVFYQRYWEDYKRLYDMLKNVNTVVPGLNRAVSEMLTGEISIAYEGMKNFDLQRVQQTKL